MNFIFVADFFANEILGGGEINNEVLADCLRRRGHSVSEKKCVHFTEDDVNNNKDACFIISNFIQLSEGAKTALKNTRYIIYEHDHKYLRRRNPAMFSNYKAPKSEIVNRDFYANALGVFCQSKFHCQILQKNLFLDNIKNLGGNLWSDESLEVMTILLQNEKQDKFSVMKSNIAHKNTAGAVRYCERNDAPYELVSSNNYHDFLSQLSRNNKFVFLPQTPETLSRVVVEARMLGVEVHTNNRVGAASEPWFPLKGFELIERMKQRREEITMAVEDTFRSGKCSFFTPPLSIPKISILTSLYKGDEHIEGFLANMTSQSVFADCELIIIDANSPGNEKEIIDRYREQYSNIIYKRLDKDPGIYGCWNQALEIASGEFVTNANLDDRRSRQQLEIFANELINNPEVDLIYSQCFITGKAGETYLHNSSLETVYPIAPFSREAMVKCLPGCMPMWRKSMHENIGGFEARYKSAGDWEMWLRAVENGSVFKMTDGIHGLYYHNPTGLSTDKSREKEKKAEEAEIFFKYSEIFGQKNFDMYKGYFSQ